MFLTRKTPSCTVSSHQKIIGSLENWLPASREKNCVFSLYLVELMPFRSQAAVPLKLISFQLSWKGLGHEVEQHILHRVTQRFVQGPHSAWGRSPASESLVWWPHSPTGPWHWPAVPTPGLGVSQKPDFPGLLRPKLSHLREIRGALGLDSQDLALVHGEGHGQYVSWVKFLDPLRVKVPCSEISRYHQS